MSTEYPDNEEYNLDTLGLSLESESSLKLEEEDKQKSPNMNEKGFIVDTDTSMRERRCQSRRVNNDDRRYEIRFSDTRRSCGSDRRSFGRDVWWAGN